MGFIPRRRIKENLRDVQVFLEDRDNTVFKVQDIPDTFVQGRSAFKLFGSEFLKPNVKLKIEILDKVGNTVYVQPVKYGEIFSPKLPYRYVSVEVYPPPINLPGEAELVILGELDDRIEIFERLYNDIPGADPFEIESQYQRFLEDFQGTYNVRFKKTINIDTEKVVNEQPILFYKKPKITATEFVKPQRKLDAPDNRFISGSQIYGIVNADIVGTAYQSSSNVINTQEDTFDVSQTSYGDLAVQANKYQIKTGIQEKVAILEKLGVKEERKSPEPPQMTIFSNESKFISKMLGGNINITGIKIPSASAFEYADVTQYEGTQYDTPENRDAIYNAFTFPNFEGTVENVISDTQLTLTQPYSIEYRDRNLPTGLPPAKIHADIGDNESGILANFTASYIDWSVPSTSSYRFDSFVDFKVEDMRTFSGDIFRVKVLGSSETSLSDFPVLLDTVVTSPELLVDTVSPSGVLRSGYFIDQTHIDKYWNTFGGNNNANQLSANYTMSLADGIYLSGSYEPYNQVGRVDLDDDYSFTVKRDVVYTLSFNAKGKKAVKNNIENDTYSSAKIFFHLSGSDLANDPKLKIQHASSFGHTITNEFGEPVGLQIEDSEQINTFKDFGRVSHTFTPKFKLDRIKNIDTILQIRIHSGEWIISDLSLRPAVATGFSPDEFTFKVPIPSNTLRPDNWSFLVQYLDVNGNISETLTFLDNVHISGSALILEGNDNLLSGSMFMGNVQGSGIEMAGANSAFVRSVGFEGFTSASVGGQGGFMIWSGSVLPNSPDNYTGAGIEIHDGVTGENESFLKFRTIDADNDYSSSFVVKTSRFFLGSTSQFVSGSGGNVEISSSNFHLTPEGNVSMSGAITAEGGTLGGFAIGDTTLTTEGVVIGNSSEDLFISSSAFKIDHTGNVTASNMDLGGKISATSGDIGGWTIEEGQLVAGVGVNSVTMSGDLALIAMGSGSTFNKGGLLGGVRLGKDTDGKFKFAIGDAGSYIHYDPSLGVSIKSDSFDVTASVADINVESFGLSANNLVITSSGQLIAAGDPIPTGIGGTNKGFFLAGQTGQVLVGDAAGAHFSFDGTSAELSSSTFYLGNDTNFISGSTGNIKIQSSGTTVLSGSEVRLETPRFYMGESSQYISGSNGNIEISSSKFHLERTGDVTMQGTVTATAGEIGGFTIDGHSLTTTGVEVNDSTQTLFISSSEFKVGHTGNVTGSQVLFDGGTIGGFTLNSGSIFTDNVRIDSVGQVVSIGSGDDSFGSPNRIFLDAAGTGSAVYQSDWSSGTDGWIGGLVSAGNQDGITDGSTTKNNTLRLIPDVGTGLHEYKEFPTIAGETYTISITYLIGNGSGGSNSHIDGFRLAINDTTDRGAGTFDPGVTGTWTTTQIAFTTTVTRADNQLRIYLTDGSSFTFGGGHGALDDRVYISNVTITATKQSRFSVGEELQFADHALTVSGSDVQLITPKFLLGDLSSQFVSGSAGNLEISSSNFHLQAAGDVSMSGNIRASGGTIAGWTLAPDRFAGGGDDEYIALIPETGIQLGNTVFANAPFSVTNEGVLKATSGTIGGFTLGTNTFTATDFTIDPSGKSISLGSGTNIFVVDGDVGLQLGHGTFGSAPFSVTKAGVLKATSGTVGGWTLGSETIVGSNLTLRSSGIIETNDFASGVKGFRLDSAGNGSAEFENITIRGTLSTAVFEKETVNAVGGQLYVANSTVITGSTNISASATTMSVVNVTGFTGSYEPAGGTSGSGEILSIKKITDTGFSTEYVLVQSASRDNPSSETDFSGKLYVRRGYQSGSSGNFVGANANLSHSYAPGQVVVSTGRIGTGYVRINANPSDQATPFIDIVERTGSGVYDVELKARLGDLSGLSTTRLHGTNPANAGFGLYSENVFLEGGIVANTGSIAGIEMESSKLYIGTGTHNNDNTAFYVDNTGKFSLKDKLVWDGSNLAIAGSITITGGPTATQLSALNDTTSSLETSVTSLGEATSSLGNQITGAVDSGSAFASDAVASGSAFASNAVVSASLVGAGAAASSSAVQNNLTSVSASTAERLVTDSKGLLLDIPNAPTGDGLFLNYPYLGFYNNSEFTAFISASGGFLFKADDNNLISFGQNADGGDGEATSSFVLRSDNVFLSGSKINMLTDKFFLGGSSVFVSGSTGNLEISSSKFHLQPDGDVVMNNITASNASVSGKITATDIVATGSGVIGGFVIDSTTLSASDVTLSSGGNLTLGTSDEVVRLSSNDANFRLWTGHATAGSAPFRVHKDGTLTATGADISGTITITSGDLANINASTISGSQNATSSSLAGSVAQTLVDSGSLAAKVQLTSTGMNILNSSDQAIAQYGADAIIGRTTAGQSNVLIDSDGAVDVRRGTAVSASFGLTGITMGPTGGQHVSIDVDSVDIKKGSDVSASFGAITTIGPTGGSHVLISGEQIAIKRASQTFLSASADGLDMSGSVQASDGKIGGFELTSTELKADTITDKGFGGNSAFVTSSVYLATRGAELNDTDFQISSTTSSFGRIVGTGMRVTSKASQGGGRTDVVIGSVAHNPSGNSPNRAMVSTGGDGGGFQFTADTGSGGETVEMQVGARTGVSPPFTVGYTRTGDIPNGNVQVTMGSTSGTHLKFDSGTPSRAATLFARTPTFFLGESGEQFISGSNGKFEISSDNFSLDVDGNVTASGASHRFGGTITANVINATGSGIIGAWNIGASAIESNTSAFRGTKIVSGSGIEGFGPTRHSKSSTTGLFNFGVAAAPGASTGEFDQVFDSPK